MKKVVAITTLLLAITGCASVDKQIDDWKLLSKEHFRQTTSLKDDDLETVAIFSTLNGHQFTQGMAGVVWDDNFFRAFIDKKTGTVTYQLYQVLRYRDSGWRFFNRFNYKTSAGVQTRPAVVVSRDVDCAGVSTTSNNCKYEEHVAITLGDEEMRELAKTYNPEKTIALIYRVASQSGKDHDDAILAAEAAGLVERVDVYLATHGLVKR